MGIQLVIIYIFEKSVKYSLSIIQKVLSLIWCLICTIVYMIYASGMLLLLFIYTANIIFIWKLTKIRLDIIVSAYLLSIGISYSLLYIAMLLIGLIFAPLLSVGYEDDTLFSYDKPIDLLVFILIATLQFILAYLLFRIKRFKNGFPFLFEKYAVVLALIVTGIVLAFVSWMTFPQETYENSFFAFMPIVIGIIIIGVGIIIWIRQGIKMFYKKKMKERNIELLEQELTEKDKEIQRLTEQNDALRVINHKTNHRLLALEQSVSKVLEAKSKHSFSMEISQELTITFEDIKRLSKEYHDNISRVKNKKILQSTKISMLDSIFEYFSKLCMDNKIDFNLKINGSIPYMVEHIIPQGKLETMIGDHLQDALIAVNSGDNLLRSILAIVGLTGDYYEFTVYDSGIPFEVDTLVRLGTERITTHTDSGGSGIGFMTTFETMRECDASLVINEKKTSISDYSKSVTIRFDGKNQYVIETYRPDAFPNRNDRFVVLKIG